jgi:hypothetical protein
MQLVIFHVRPHHKNDSAIRREIEDIKIEAERRVTKG